MEGSMLRRFSESLGQLAGADYAGKKYLLAVSGGADSTVMTMLFHAARLDFAVAHCNFHLRGADSDRDMEFVKKLSQNLGARLFVKEFDTLGIQKNEKKSVEMVARDLRYAWFAEIMEGFDFLVTAHNANDAAETHILNIIRGSGMEGMRSVPEKNGYVIRPMLSFSAKEIREWAKANGVPYVEDCTNADESIRRNRIRHSVVPVCEEINPNFIETHIRNRKLFVRQYGFYRHFLQKEINKMAIYEDGGVRIDKECLFKSFDPQILLYEILSRYGFSGDTSFKIAEKGDIPTGKTFYSRTHKLLVERKCLIVSEIEKDVQEETLISGFSGLAAHFLVEERIKEGRVLFDKDPFVFYVPAEKLQFPLRIRFWKHGDYFFPLGAKGRKKLSDFFIDEKVSLFDKGRIPILCDDDAIMWIIGYRSDRRFKVDGNTVKYYKLTYLKKDNA